MNKEIYLEFDEGDSNLQECLAWIIILAFVICGLIFKNTLAGLLGIFFFIYRHITIIVKEKKK